MPRVTVSQSLDPITVTHADGTCQVYAVKDGNTDVDDGDLAEFLRVVDSAQVATKETASKD